jgi:hypothetical protein
MKKNNDMIKQPMKNINTMKIMKKFLFLKIFFLALYSPTIFAAVTCSTGSGGSSASYSWSQETTPTFLARESHSSVEFGDKMWVLGGEGITDDGGFLAIRSLDEVWSSADGKTWTEVTKDSDSSAKFTRRNNHSSVVFDDGSGEKIWIIGGIQPGVGRLNDVWNSSDGKTWTRVRRTGAAKGFHSRSNHTSVVFDNRIWVFGGTGGSQVSIVYDDVWSSTNGVTWEEKTDGSSKKFPARFDHQSIVFNDGSGEKIWVIGGTGTDDSSFFDDVWSSTDGKTWTEETKDSSKKFPARAGHASEVFDNQMWVFGGNASSSIDSKNDVWSSDDGKNWTKVRGNGDANGFTVRTKSTAVLFKNKVWLIAGRHSSPLYLNDVWSMTKN